MGGLIARGAVYGSAKGESGFSKPIDVEDGVTLAATDARRLPFSLVLRPDPRLQFDREHTRY